MSGGHAWTGVTVAAVIAGYALVSRRLSTTPVSSPMVFVGCGILLGPAGLGLLDLAHDAGPVLTLVEAALTLVLFTDAMTIRRRDLRIGGFLPLRLLAIGLPLTVGAGWLLAWPLLPGLSAWELALLAAVLAPTDAALGKDAVFNPRVPGVVRKGLNVESGLNDGLVLPFFVLFLAALPGTVTSQEGVHGVLWRTLVLSTVLGLAVGWAGGRLLDRSWASGWASRPWRQVFVPATAAVAYGLAAGTDGSGFIAAWVAGFAFALGLRTRPGAEEATDDRTAESAEFAEYLGGLLAALSFLVFGAVLLGPTLEHLTWRIAGYAVLSLTVVRMVPVALSLVRSGFRPRTVAYIGWFGPRGLASIVFGLLVVEEQVEGVGLIGAVVAATVGLSVLLHGLSAVLLSDRYGAWYEAAAAAVPGLREATAAPDEPGRGRVGHRGDGRSDPDV
ncbi:cation:proton antiporter [Kitasatospora camelliae]|uniref:Cation:proton antiporter n=1 Tax=Kitasatospora camelliae TaxID=3156397 RepID=A0AAU8JQ52_9ACTN